MKASELHPIITPEYSPLSKTAVSKLKFLFSPNFISFQKNSKFLRQKFQNQIQFRFILASVCPWQFPNFPFLTINFKNFKLLKIKFTYPTYLPCNSFFSEIVAFSAEKHHLGTT